MIVLPDGLDPRVEALIRLIQADLPIVENPPGSNRSPEIDAMCDEFDLPRGSSWCALWAASRWRKAGLDIPPFAGTSHPAIADSWRVWAHATGRAASGPVFGGAVVYDLTGRGVHGDHLAACVMATAPIPLAAEGNTSLAGVSREGVLTAVKPIRTPFAICYVSPLPLG